MAEQRVEFKGTFNVSEILNSIKQMRAELAKTGKSPLLGNLDKEISKIEELGTTLQAQINKGFTSSKEMKNFTNQMDRLEEEARKVGETMKNINGDHLEASLKNVSKQITELRKKVQDLNTAFATSFTADTKSFVQTQAGRDMAKQIKAAAAAGREYKDVVRDVKSEYDRLIQAQQQEVNLAQQKLNNVTPNVPASGFKANQFKDAKTGGAITNDQKNQVVAFYDAAIKGANSASEAAQRFLADLKKIGIEAKSDAPQKVVERNFTSYKSGSANNANTKAATKDLQAQQQLLQQLTDERTRYLALLSQQQGQYNNIVNNVNRLTQAEQNQANVENKLRTDSAALGSQINTLNNDINKETAAWKSSASATQDVVSANEKMNRSFDNIRDRITYIFSLGNAFYQVKRVLQSTLEDAKNIDKAFASIAMVTEKTVSGLWERYREYADLAQSLGQSTESAIKASALFYQQGLKDKEVMELTTETMKLATLAGLDFEKATSQMTAALRGFHMEMDQGAHVTDVYSELAAHAAADVNGIAYAMSKTASIANNAGMAFETTAAFLTQMIETTQEAPENIGTAMKTIIARFTELKKNVAGTAESEFEDLDYNKVDKALKSVGVSIKDLNGQFRNLDDVFLELSQKWDTLDRNSQRYIATIAAGSRQQSRFIAMMENYERVNELINITADAEGRANEQFAKNAESLQFKIQSLKTAWEKARIDFTKADFFKGIVDGATTLVNILNDLSKNPKKLIATFTAAAIVIKNLFTNTLNGIKTGLPELKKSISDLFTKTKTGQSGLKIKIDQAYFADQVKQAKELAEQQLTSDGMAIFKELEGRDFGKYRVDSNQNGDVLEISGVDVSHLNDRDKQLLDGYIRAHVELEANQRSTQLAKTTGTALGTVVTAAATAAMASGDPTQGLRAAIMSGVTILVPQVISFFTKLFTFIKAGADATAAAVELKMAVATMGITALISAATAGIMALVALAKREKDTIGAQIDDMENRIKAAQERAAEAKKQYQSDKETADNLEELKKKYDELNSKVVKTTEEQEEYKEVVDKIREDFPELVNSYDEVTGKLITQNDLWDQILEKQIESAKLAGNAYVGELRGIEADTQTKNDLEDKQIELNKKYSDDVLKSLWWNVNNSAYDLTSEKGFTDYFQGTADAMNGQYGTSYSVSDIKQMLGVDTLAEMQAFAGSLKKVTEIINDEEFLPQWEGGAYEQAIEDYFAKREKQADQEHKLNMKLARESSEAAVKQSLQTQLGISEEVATYLSRNESIYDMAIPKNERNRGYFANMLGGGVYGDNTNSSNRKFTNSNLTDWANIDKEIQDLILAGGLSKSEYADLSTDAEGIEKIFQAYLEGLNKKYGKQIEEAAGELYENFSKVELDAVEDFIKNGSTYNQKQLDEYANKFDTEDEKAFAKSQADELKKVFAEEFYSDKPINAFLGLTKEDAKDWSLQQIQLINSSMQGALDDIGNDKLAKQYFDSIAKTLEENKIDKKEWAAYFDIDFTGLTEKNRDKWIEDKVKEMREAGYTMGTEMMEAFVGAAEEYGRVDLIVDTLAEATAYLEEMKKTSEDMYKATGDFVAVIAEQMVKGEVSLDNYMKLKKDFEDLGKSMGDYFSIDENGTIVANEEALKELYEQEVGLEKQKLQEKINTLKVEDAELAVQEATLKAQIEAIDAGMDIPNVNAEINTSLQPIVENWTKILELVSKYKGEEFDDRGFKFTDSYVSKANREEYKAALQAELDAIATQRTGVQETVDLLQQELEDSGNLDAAKLNSFLNDIADEVEKLKKQEEDAAKAAEDLEKKLKALNEVLYGDEYHKNKTDYFYNYTTALSKLTSEANKAKSALESLQEGEDPAELLDQYTKSAQAAANARAAQNIILEDSIDAYAETLIDGLTSELERLNDLDPNRMISTNVEDYFHIDDATGRWLIDYNALNEAMIPDDISDYVEDSITQINKWMDEIDKNIEEEEKLAKEVKDMQEKALSNMISLEDEVIKTLQEKYKQEIEETKNKYDALADLNDEYLEALEEAINKERDLRDRENAMNELATKEKRLSLMMRDTSGSNQKEVAELNKEIEEDRQQLLDDTVDDILEQMKESYEEQKEANEEKIALLENLVSDAEIMREAVGIISSWQNVDDMIGWMFDNNTGIDAMSENKLEQAINQWQQNYRNADAAKTILGSDLLNSVLPTDQGVNNALDKYSTPIETEAERILNQTIEKTSDAIIAAQKAVADAQEKATKNEKRDFSAEIAEIRAKYEKEASSETSKSSIVYNAKDLGNLREKTDLEKRSEWVSEHFSKQGVSMLGMALMSQQARTDLDKNADGKFQITELEEFLRRVPEARYQGGERWKGLLGDSMFEKQQIMQQEDNMQKNRDRNVQFVFNVDVDNNGEPMDETKIAEALKKAFVDTVQDENKLVILNDYL